MYACMQCNVMLCYVMLCTVMLCMYLFTFTYLYVFNYLYIYVLIYVFIFGDGSTPRMIVFASLLKKPGFTNGGPATRA